MAIGTRYYQEIPYGTAEWRDAYRSRRNQIEGHNRILKNAGASGIALADHRKFRGLGKQALALAFKMAAANLSTIGNFFEA